MTEQADIQKELVHEAEALNMGLIEYRRRNERLKSIGLESRTDYGKKLLIRAIEPFSAAISEFVKEAEGKAGPRHTAVKFFEQMDPDLVALLACRVIFNELTRSSTSLTSNCITIGSRVEEELRFGKLNEDEPKIYAAVKRNAEKVTWGAQEEEKRKRFGKSMKRYNVSWMRWSRADKVHVGMKLIELFIESVGLVQIGKRYMRRNKTLTCLEPTEELTQWISEFSARSEIMSPFFLPMICPPKDWVSLFGGGYYNRRLQSMLIKTRTRGYIEEMKYREMPTVYSAVNALQAVPWKINCPMLDIINEVWDSGLEVEGMPARHDHTFPPKPTDFSNNPEAKQRWKVQAAITFEENRRNASKRIQTATTLWLGKRFSTEAKIWFPVQLDFRGRMYCVPQYLNPQGCDLAKSLLTFARGKPLGQDGSRWLAVHVANCFGYDKCSLEARAEWTRQNSERIVRVANDPLEDKWWTEADKPFQFLAACIEWVGYTTDGENYVCSLPVMVDGSCNGIQNFAAMLRDEVAGRNVNLIPQDKPADIYAEVALQVEAELRKHVTASESTAEYARGWLAFGIDRKMCKRPVMVLPYGGSREAVRKYIFDRVTEVGQHSFGINLPRAVSFLATVVWEVMARVVVGPRKAMDWLKEVSKIISREDIPLVWATPSGFMVQQAYPETRSRRIKTRVGDSVVFVSVREETMKLDRRKQSQAVAPNFVHSLDASALALTIVKSKEQGIDHFAAVHDSYGTLAADMGVLSSILRESFVAMYQNNDVLAQFSNEVGSVLGEDEHLPPPPEKGTLDLAGVLNSPFFFS